MPHREQARPPGCPFRMNRCRGKVGGLKTLNNNIVNRNHDGNPIPQPLPKSEERIAALFKLTHQGLKTALPDTRPSSNGLECTAVLAQDPALCPGATSWGRGGGGAPGASRENAAKGPQEYG